MDEDNMRLCHECKTLKSVKCLQACTTDNIRMLQPTLTATAGVSLPNIEPLCRNNVDVVVRRKKGTTTHKQPKQACGRYYCKLCLKFQY